MAHFEIVAHRGIASEAPENTVAAFQRALELGADAIELDVRLTADRVPVIYHYFYLDEITTGRGPIFARSLAQLRAERVLCRANLAAAPEPIPTLREVLEHFGGRIGLEIEIKGPEPEAAEVIGAELRRFRQHWPRLELTSYEPALLLALQGFCPGLTTDLLVPRSESWMQLDVVAYQAGQRARLAHAHAVHLHPTQLTPAVVAHLREQNVQVHAWDVNDAAGLETIAACGIPRICTDNFNLAWAFRKLHAAEEKAPRPISSSKH